MTESRSLQMLQVVALLLIAAIPCPCVAGKIIYVDDDAPGLNNGLSWRDAYRYLQDALADANAAKKPVTIRVAGGTYRPSQVTGRKSDDFRVTFRLINGVSLEGGYAGRLSSNSYYRNLSRYPSILRGPFTGDSDRPPAVGPGAIDRRSVVMADGTDGTAVLDGFVITAWDTCGQGTGELISFDGGGLYNRNSSPTVKQCTFLGDRSACGPGMYNLESSPTVTSCTFSGTLDGGMYNDHSSPAVTDCVFHSNDQAILNDRASNPTLVNCTFTQNGSSWGIPVWSCDSSPTFRNCRFMRNTAEAVMHNSGGSPTLVNCLFTGNSITQPDGSQISNSDANLTVLNCTFIGNPLSPTHTLGFWSYEGKFATNTAKLTNCILWGSDHQIQAEEGCTTTVVYSDVQGGWPGEGNIDADPCFADPGRWDPNGTPDDPNDDVWIEGDYHLGSQVGRWDPMGKRWVLDERSSPCIDGGDPNTPVGDEPPPNGSRIDMGFYGGTAEASKSPVGIHDRYGGGSGTPKDPYLIHTAEQMNTIGANPSDWDKHFKLMADIDLSAYKGTQFNLIGRWVRNQTKDNKAFCGVFDGNWKVIRNFTWESTQVDAVGLFVNVEPNPHGDTIRNLGLLDVDIRAENSMYVGALAAVAGGDIANCYVTGQISGGGATAQTHRGGAVGGLTGWLRARILCCCTNAAVKGDWQVGGLAGMMSDHARIADCYANGVVTGISAVGGLTGIVQCDGCEDMAMIQRCYSTVVVQGQGESIGALAGWSGGSIVSSFWDTQISGMDTMCEETGEYACGWGGGEGKTTAEMMTEFTFFDWAGCNNERSWTLDEGLDYPRLWWEQRPGKPIDLRLSDFLRGDGTPESPYLINTAEQLNTIGLSTCDFDKHFKLMADLDLSAYAGTQFHTIGVMGDPFTGVFDGNDHTLSNLSSTRGGLFGYVTGDAQIKNLGPSLLLGH